MIVTTIGLSILIREAALLAWESRRTLPFLGGTSLLSPPRRQFSPAGLLGVGATALIVTGLTAFFKFTLTGKAMRGCSADRDGASLCGIDPDRMVAMAFGMSAGIGALAGCVAASRPDALRDRGDARDQGLYRGRLRRPGQRERP